MSMVIEPVSEAPIVTEEEVRPRGRLKPPQWRLEHLGLGAVLLLAAFLGIWNLSINGYSNEYYAAAVRSMIQSWHNFFYVSFDPGGFVTVDKPPVAFWVQAAFAKVLGFSGVSLLLPEALAGVGGVFLLYLMVKRAFGSVAGLLAGLILAVTPIFVVMNRDNNPDSILVFTLILAAWALLRAAEKGRWGWLVLSGVLVGVAFNVKMLEAYVVLPAFYTMYFLFARVSWRKKILDLTLLTLVIAAVSLSWAVAVDLTPASQRPYVGGSSNNTEMDLILNYNGLGRVDGNEMGGTPGGTGGAAPSTNGADFTRPDGTGAPNGNNGGMFGTGNPGLTRLLVPRLAGEFNWFGPLALLGLVYLMAQAWFGMPKGEARSRRLQTVALWGGWMLTFAAVFSFSKGIFHNYYLTILAPAVAALAGSALVMLWQSYRRGGWQAWLLPIGLAGTAFYQAYILSGYTSWNAWLGPVLVVVGIVALVGLALGLWLRQERFGRGLALGVTGTSVAALLVTPTLWSVKAVFTAITGAMPSGTLTGRAGGGPGFSQGNESTFQSWLSFVEKNLSGQLVVMAGAVVIGVAVVLGMRFLARRPNTYKRFNRSVVAGLVLALFLTASTGWWVNVAQAQTSQTTTTSQRGNFGGGQPGGQPGSMQANSSLVKYLEANQGDYKYLVAVSSAMQAESIIIETGQPVMALGGFNGGDKIITSTAQLQELIANHTVRYFLLGGGGGPGGNSNNSVSQYVQQNCTLVNSSQYSSSTTPAAPTGTTISATGTSGTATSDNSNRNFGGQQQSLYVCGS